jgi:hypothetical protein
MIACPFCGETDFDLIGLKSHLLNHCEEFDQTPSVLEAIRRREQENAQKPR